MRRRVFPRRAGCTSARRGAAPKRRAAGRDEASASSRATPLFCGSSPVLTSTSSVGVRPSRCDRGGDGVGEPRAVERLDHVGEAHRVARLVGLQPADEVQPQRRDTPARKAGNLAAASCTRFSPNTSCPAASAARTASAGLVLETATRVMSDGRRPARIAALGDAVHDAAQILGNRSSRLCWAWRELARRAAAVKRRLRRHGRVAPGHDRIETSRTQATVPAEAGSEVCVSPATVFRKCRAEPVLAVAGL